MGSCALHFFPLKYWRQATGLKWKVICSGRKVSTFLRCATIDQQDTGGLLVENVTLTDAIWPQYLSRRLRKRWQMKADR